MSEKIFEYLIILIQKKPVRFVILKLSDLYHFLKKTWDVWVEFIIAKLLLLTAVGLVLAYGTYHLHPNTPRVVLAAIFLTCLAGAIIAGYAELYIAKNNVEYRTIKAFSNPPLSQFLENGFDHRFKHIPQLWGTVNNYTIIVAPAHGAIMNIITIRIPLSSEIADQYLGDSLTPYFSIVDERFVYMARADIDNYTDKLNYFELMHMISQATDKLQKLDLKPYNFVSQ